MTSLIRLSVGLEYYLSARKTVNKWLYEEWWSIVIAAVVMVLFTVVVNIVVC